MAGPPAGAAWFLGVSVMQQECGLPGPGLTHVLAGKIETHVCSSGGWGLPSNHRVACGVLPVPALPWGFREDQFQLLPFQKGDRDHLMQHVSNLAANQNWAVS